MTASPHPASPGWVHLAERGMLRRDDLTVDDLVDLPEDLRYELIDGRFVATPSALPLDQLPRIEAANAIEEQCPDEFVINVGQMILIDRHNQLRPDVVLIHEQGAGHSPVLPGDVPLIVEVGCHPSSSGDRALKLKKCAHAGIPSYWIIDPLAERITFAQFCLDPDGAYECRLESDELVTVTHPWEVTLDLPAWTRKRDRLRQASRRDT